MRGYAAHSYMFLCSLANALGRPRRSMIIEDESPSVIARRSRTEALASGFIPGAGQLLQHRPLAAIGQFTTVIAYLVIGAHIGLRHAMLFAFAWNCYSVIDAYRHRLD